METVLIANYYDYINQIFITHQLLIRLDDLHINILKIMFLPWSALNPDHLQLLWQPAICLTI